MIDLKKVLREYLESKGNDGLWQPDVPCGCLNSDLMPCGIDWGTFADTPCCAGWRREYKAEETCDCDGNGTDHWHVGPKDKQQQTEGG